MSETEVLSLEDLDLEDSPVDEFPSVVEEPSVLEVPAPKTKAKAKKSEVGLTEALTDIFNPLVTVTRGSSVEDEIGDAGAAKAHARILIYGKNKTGKTTFSASYGKGTLVAKFEDGTLSARGSGAKDYPKKGKIEAWEQVEELYWYLKAKCDDGTCPYDVLVFDTITRMRQLVLRHTVLGTAAFDPTKDIFNPSQREYGQAGQRMVYWLSAFADLPIHILWLAQEKSGGDDAELSQYEGYPDLPTMVRNYVQGDADVIGRLYKKSVEKDGKTGVSFRVKFGPDEAFITGDRTRTLPAAMANPNLRAIIEKMFTEGGESKSA